MSPASFFTAGHWDQPLSQLGFSPTGGSAIYCRQDCAFSIQQGWGVLRQEWRPRRKGIWTAELGAPGLWKLHLDPLSDQVQPVFELPPAVLQAADPARHGQEGAQLFREVLSWALATADGPCPQEWSLPDRDRVKAGLTDHGLTVQVGSVMRQGHLVCQQRQLALRFPLLPRVPDDLSANRALWLQTLLIRGNNLWNMVRVGWTPEKAVLMEVDLSGVPHPVLEMLSRIGLDALRFALEGLVRQADFLADGKTVCRSVEVHTPRAVPAKQGGGS
jgi:hypothetical protein